MELDIKKPSQDNSSNSKRLIKLKDDINKDSKTMQLSYAQRLENSARKMQERYNQAKDNRQKISVIGLCDAPNPCRRGTTMIKKLLPNNGVRNPLMSNVKRTSSCVKNGGGVRSNSQGYGGITKVNNNGTIVLSKKRDELNEKQRLNEVFKLSYAERAEKVKRKLQQQYDQRQESRKKACLMS